MHLYDSGEPFLTLRSPLVKQNRLFDDLRELLRALRGLYEAFHCISSSFPFVYISFNEAYTLLNMSHPRFFSFINISIGPRYSNKNHFSVLDCEINMTTRVHGGLSDTKMRHNNIQKFQTCSSTHKNWSLSLLFILF